jgi:hypothetical protein
MKPAAATAMMVPPLRTAADVATGRPVAVVVVIVCPLDEGGISPAQETDASDGLAGGSQLLDEPYLNLRSLVPTSGPFPARQPWLVVGHRPHDLLSAPWRHLTGRSWVVG